MVRQTDFRALAQSRSGTAAVEAALTIPVFLLLLLATFDFAMGFSARMNLVSTAARTAELATGVGQVRADYAFLKAEAEAAASNPDAVATVDTWLECDGIRNGPITNVCPSGQAFARYVKVQVRATYNPFFGLGGFLKDGVPIGGEATVRIQ